METGKNNEDKEHLTLKEGMTPLTKNVRILIEDPGPSQSDDERIRGQKSLLPKIKIEGNDSQVQQNVA